MKVRAAFIAARALIFIPTVTAAASALAILISYFIRDGRFIHQYIVRPSSRIILWLADAKVTVSGYENVPDATQACITVFNHQSHLDIPLLAYSLPMQLRFIGKKELKRVPFFGPAILRMGHFLINRKDHQSALKELKIAGESIRGKGISLGFAPEGTRSPDGCLLPFRKGAFVLSIETGLPILPVTVDGTSKGLPKGSLIARSSRVHVTIHPQVSPSGFTYENRDELLEKVKNILEIPLTVKVS